MDSFQNTSFAGGAKKPLRPVLKVERTRFEIYCEFVAIAAVLFSLFYLFFVWSTLPEKIPSHFNFSGQADEWSGKGSILIVAGVSLFVYLMLTILSRYPQIYNYPWKITEENAARQYLLARQFLVALKTEIVILFAYIEWQTFEVALGHGQGLHVWFLPVFLVVIFGSIALYFIKAYRAR